MKTLSNEVAIPVEWSSDQIGLVARALVQMPFIDVFEIMEKLSQVSQKKDGESRTVLLNKKEIRICLISMRNTTSEDYKVLVLDLQKQLINHGILGEPCE